MAELNRRPPGFLFPSEPGITVQLLPAKILERAISLAADRVSLPRYVAAMVELGGERFPVGNRQAHRAEPAALPALLGDVAGQFQALSPAGLHPAAFAVQVYLADAPLFYAHQRQRALWYGGLVFAAAVTALVGLLAARSAFHRQLRLSDLKSSFVASVSHELRAPLASVRLLAESLDRGKVGEEAGRKEYFRLIVQECRRLSALIENVLDFSRIDQGRKRYEFELTDLAALVRQTVGLMQPYAAERQVRLALEVADRPLALVADGKAIQQALVNLIDNAVKHSPPGETVLVALSAVAGANNTPPPAPAAGRPASEPAPENEVAAGQLFLSVADCGPGIPMAEQECIFEPFYRRGSELRRETPGVGIGLSIVKHIVEAHSGRVRVDSTPGKGSRFTIELPAKHDYP
jgi:signal transduction histidine kinase